MGGDEPEVNTHGTITHGICQECRFNIKAQRGVLLQEYLDHLDVPVLLVDSDVKIIGANNSACELLGKDITDMEGCRGGDVFECEYARLPRGCGNTIHCSGCAVRRTVTDTHLTGKLHRRVPAYLNMKKLKETHRFDLFITTEKVDDAVLLRIDGFSAAETGHSVTL